MASNYVEISEEVSEQQHHNQHEHHNYSLNNQAPSPRSFKRQWSSNSNSSCASGDSSAQPKCVCAPATHANSFKCRLHRSASQGHSSGMPPQAPTRSSSASASSRTVEAL